MPYRDPLARVVLQWWRKPSLSELQLRRRSDRRLRLAAASHSDIRAATRKRGAQNSGCWPRSISDRAKLRPNDSSRQEPARVPRDHQFLVCRNQPGGHSGAGHANPRAARSIRGCIGLDAEPGRISADPFPNVGRVLTNATGEYDRIQSSKGGGKRTGLSPNAIAKK